MSSNIHSLYTGAKAKADNSPRKRAALSGFTPRATSSKKAHPTQPITAWFSSSTTDKQEAIATGSVAALLLIKKHDKVTPISLITPSAERPDAYKIQASDDLSVSAPAYFAKRGATKSICGIIDRTLALEFKIQFVDIDLRDGLANVTDASKAPLAFTDLPDEFPPDKAAALAADDPNKDNTPVLALLPVAVPIGYGKPAPSGSLADESTQTLLQNIADPFKAWADSVLHTITHHEGKSLHRMHGLTAAQFVEYVPGSARDKDKWATALTNDIYSVLEAMTLEDADYADQHNAAQQAALFQHENFVTLNAAAKEAYTVAPPQHRSSEFADALNNVASMAGGQHRPDPLLKQQHLLALRLLCLQKDEQGEYSIPEKLNPAVDFILKSGMKATGAMTLNRALARFTTNFRQCNNQFAAPFAIEQKYNKQAWTLFLHSAWQTDPINSKKDLLDEEFWTIFNLTEQNPDNEEYLRDSKQIGEENAQAIAGWDTKERAKSSTKPTRSFDINDEHAAVTAMANFVVLIQFLATDEKYQQDEDKKLVLVEWIEDIVYLICKKADRSWKKELDQNAQWFWFQCIRRLTNILSRYFNFVLDPEVSSAAAKDVMPAKDNAALTVIDAAFRQLYCDIQTAEANGDGRPLADSTPPTLWLAACPSHAELYTKKERAKLGITDQPAQQQQPARRGRERGNNHSDRSAADNSSSNNRGGSNSNANQTNQSRGILVRIDANKGIGVNNTTVVPSFPLKGQDRELCLKFTTRGCSCTYGNKCNKFHLTEKLFLNFELAKQEDLDKLVSSLSNIAFAEGFAKADRTGSTSRPTPGNSNHNPGTGNTSEGGNSTTPTNKKKKGEAAATPTTQGLMLARIAPSANPKSRVMPIHRSSPPNATLLQVARSPDRKKTRHNFRRPSPTRQPMPQLPARRPPPPLARRHGAWKQPRRENCHTAAMLGRPNPPPARTNIRYQAAQTPGGPAPDAHAKLHSVHPLAQQLTEINATHLEILMQGLREHRAAALPTAPTAPSQADICSGIAALSNNMRHEVTVLQRMRFLRNQQTNPFAKQSLPPFVDPTTLYPTKADLHKVTKFGKSHPDKSFVVSPATPQIILPVLKSGFLDQASVDTIRQLNMKCDLLVSGWLATRQIDFRALQYPNFDWEATSVNKDKLFLRMAAFYHYDLDIASLQRFCGWRATGEHRRQDELLHWSRYVLSAEVFAQLWPGYIHGTPNRMHSLNDKHTYANYLKYRDHGNAKNLAKYPALVEKSFAKEDARDISMILPSFLVDFTPHTWLIPLGISVVENKKPRMYRSATMRIDDDSYPVNRLVDKTNEPEIVFGSTQREYFEYLWRTRATYPDARIQQYSDDISSCFNQRQTHPDIVSANASLYKGYLVFPTGMHFGGTWCPANSEPIARAKAAMTEFMFNHCTHQLRLNADVLPKLKVHTPPLTQPLAAALLDSPDEAQSNADGTLRYKALMYVDDALTAVTNLTENGVFRMASSSLEAGYIFYGFPGPIECPLITPSMAWDKLDALTIGPVLEVLGIIVDTDKMEISIPLRRLARLQEILRRQWNRNRKTFTARGAAQLIGNLLSCLQGCHWLKMLLFNFQTALRQALRNNASRLAHSKHFEAILAETHKVWLEADGGAKDAKLLGLRSAQARLLWRCEAVTFTPLVVHEQAEWLLAIIDDHLQDNTTWTRPISHIVRRQADWKVIQDASSSFGTGGHAPVLRFFFQVSWADFGPAVVDKIRNTLNQGGVTDMHINWMEYIASLLSYAGTLTAAQAPEHWRPYPPTVLLVGDNMTANKAVKKGSARSDSIIAQALTKIFCWLQRHSQIATDSTYVNTHDNLFADDLSRAMLATWVNKLTTMSTNELITYTMIPQTNEPLMSTLSYRRFLPSADLMSAILGAVLLPEQQPNSFPQLNVKNLGRLSGDNSISINFSPKR